MSIQWQKNKHVMRPAIAVVGEEAAHVPQRTVGGVVIVIAWREGTQGRGVRATGSPQFREEGVSL